MLQNHATPHKTTNAMIDKKHVTLLDLCVSSLRRGHANLLCIVPILTDDPRRESDGQESNRRRWDSRPRHRSIKHKEGATVPFLKARKARVTTTIATMTRHYQRRNTLSPHVQCLAQASTRMTSAKPGNMHTSANPINFKALVNGFVPEGDDGCNGTSMTLHVTT